MLALFHSLLFVLVWILAGYAGVLILQINGKIFHKIEFEFNSEVIVFTFGGYLTLISVLFVLIS